MAFSSRPDVIEQLVKTSERALSAIAGRGLVRGELVFTGPCGFSEDASSSLDSRDQFTIIAIPAFEFDAGGTKGPAFRPSPEGDIMSDDISAALRQAVPQIAVKLSEEGLTVSNTAFSRLFASMSVEWLSADDEVASRKGADMPGGLDALVAGVPPEDIIA